MDFSDAGKHFRSLSREEFAETGEEAGFLTNGSSPGFSPSPFFLKRVAGHLKQLGRRSRLSGYSGGTAWELHPLPFYPNVGTSVRISEIKIRNRHIPPNSSPCQKFILIGD
jgi:hypothetical protein